MLDLAWSEILLIAVVALVVIGPKDLPGAIRGIADLIKTGKKKLASFQQQADELVREAKLDEVRNQIADVKGALNEIRNFDLKGEITKAVDSDGTLTKTFSENPMGGIGGGSSTPAWTPPPTARDTPDAPAMIPPQTMAPYKAPDPLPTPPAPDMPSFVPPSTPAPLNVAPPPVVAEASPVPPTAPAPIPPAAPVPATPAATMPSSPAAEAAAKTA